MAHVSMSVTIGAAPAVVWKHVSDLASHPQWMHDAVAIRFVSEARSGPGVVMDCDTKVGPVKLTDRLVVTEWVEGRAISIRHAGAVTGTGRFALAAADHGCTLFSWAEDLRFPWWMGGPAGATAARPVLAWTWRRNLSTLRSLIEDSRP